MKRYISSFLKIFFLFFLLTFSCYSLFVPALASAPANTPSSLTQSTPAGALTAATYYYQITAVTVHGETGVSTLTSISANGTNSQNTISWNAVVGVSNYRVYRGVGSSTMNQYYQTTNTSLLDNGLLIWTAGTPPMVNTATTDTNTVSLSFSSVAGATAYRIYKGSSSGAENTYFLVSSASASLFIDTGGSTQGATPTTGTAGPGTVSVTSLPVGGNLIYNQTIYYKISAVVGGVETSPSAEQTITTASTLSVPTNAASSTTSSSASVIGSGVWNSMPFVSFQALVSSGNPTDTLNLLVEIQPLGTAFTNATATIVTSGVGVYKSQNYAYNGTSLAASVIGMALPTGQFHWQALVMGTGGNSIWVANGGNPDFGISAISPLVSTLNVSGYSSSPAQILFDNFSTGTFLTSDAPPGKWGTKNGTVLPVIKTNITGNAYQGTNVAFMNSPTSTDTSYLQTANTLNSQSEQVTGYYNFQNITLGSGHSDQLMSAVNVGSSTILTLSLDNSGSGMKLQVRNNVTSVNTLGSTSLIANKWYSIGINLTVGTTPANGSFTILLNGMPEISQSGINTGSANIGSIKVGIGGSSGSGNTLSYYLGNVRIENTSGLTPLISGNATPYSYQNPYFEFFGQNDGNGSGIANYNNYFGVDPTVIPGNTSTAANFTASTLVTTGVYYFSLYVLDNAGNTSPVKIGFVYPFQSPASAPNPPTNLSQATSQGQLPANTYYYQITALTSHGETTPSASPASIVVTGSNQAVTISWNGVAGASAYKVYRGVGSSTMIEYIQTTNTSLLSDGNKTWIAGSVPSTNTAYTDSNQNSITFGTVAGASAYRVYRGSTSNGENTYSLLNGGRETTFIDNGSGGSAGSPVSGGTAPSGITINTNPLGGSILYNTTTYYKVSAIVSGIESNPSVETSITSGGMLGVPTGVSVVSSSVNGTIINASSWISTSYLSIGANISGTTNPDLLSLLVEIQSNGTPFTNSTNTFVTSGTGVYKSSNYSYTGSLIAVKINVQGLSTASQYHWQVLTQGSGANSVWVQNGGNPDFGVDIASPTVSGMSTIGYSAAPISIFNDSVQSGTLLTSDTPAGKWAATGGDTLPSVQLNVQAKTFNSQNTIVINTPTGANTSYVTTPLFSGGVISMTGYFYFKTLSLSSGHYATLFAIKGTGNSDVGSLEMTNGGGGIKLQAGDAATSTNYIGTTTIVVNQWYAFTEIFTPGSGTNGSIQVNINGIPEITNIGINTGTSSITSVRVGVVINSGANNAENFSFASFTIEDVTGLVPLISNNPTPYNYTSPYFEYFGNLNVSGSGINTSTVSFSSDLTVYPTIASPQDSYAASSITTTGMYYLSYYEIGNNGYISNTVLGFAYNYIQPAGNPNNPSSLVQSLTGGTLSANTYYYQVSAITAFGETTAAPNVPVSVTTTGTNSQNTLTWNAVPGAASYKIYRGIGSAIMTSFTTTTNTTAVLNGVNYLWTNGTVPSTNTATTNTNANTITWNPVSGASAYRIYSGTSSGGENKYIQINSGLQASFIDTGSIQTAGSTTTGGSAVPGSITSGTNALGGNIPRNTNTFYQISTIINGVEGNPSTEFSITAASTIFPPTNVSVATSSQGTSLVGTGGWIKVTSLALSASISGTTNPDPLYLLVEVQPVAGAFTNSLNTFVTSGVGVYKSTSNFYTGTPITASVTIINLPSNTSYHWQALVMGSGGNSSWTAKGGSPDFMVNADMLLSKINAVAYSASPTVLFNDAFSSGTILTTDAPAGKWRSKNGSNLPQIQSNTQGNTLLGTNSVMMSASLSTDSSYLSSPIGLNTTSLQVTGFFYFKNLVIGSGHTTNLLSLVNGGGANVAGLSLANNGGIKMQETNYIASTTSLGSSIILPNQWYGFTLAATISATNGIITSSIDGNVEITQTSQNTGTSNLNSFLIGDISNNGANTINVSLADVRAENTSGVTLFNSNNPVAYSFASPYFEFFPQNLSYGSGINNFLINYGTNPTVTPATQVSSLSYTVPNNLTPGLYYFSSQAIDTGGNTSQAVISYIYNGSPTTNTPTGLGQFRNDGITPIINGAWSMDGITNNIVFTFTMTSSVNPDTLTPEIELQPNSTAFTGTPNYTGSSLSYSGNSLQGQINITGLSNCGSYHWQAFINNSLGLSAPVQFNASSPNFNLENTLPATATVFDGAINGSESGFNNSLTTMHANWAPFIDTCNAYGTTPYQFEIGTTSGGNDILAFTSSGITLGSVITAATTSINMTTGVTYYVTVKATNLSGLSTTVSSIGQINSPVLSFSLDSNNVTMGNWTALNSYTTTANTTLTISTNAHNGYNVYGYESSSLTSANNPAFSIPDFAGTYAAPQIWNAGVYGFGYTSSWGSIFANRTKYAGFNHASPGDLIGQNSTLVNGANYNPANPDTYTITYKAALNPISAAGVYNTVIIYNVVPSF